MAVTARDAFEALVRGNADMLRAFLLSFVRDPRLADELFQGTFLTAWKKFDTYDPERPFSAWVRPIAAELATVRKREVPSDSMLYFDQETLALLEIQFARATRVRKYKWDNKVEVLKQCMNALPQLSLDVISLYYHKNYNCREIANRLGIEVEAAKKELQNSRKLLFDCVQSKLADSGVGRVQ